MAVRRKRSSWKTLGIVVLIVAAAVIFQQKLASLFSQIPVVGEYFTKAKVEAESNVEQK